MEESRRTWRDRNRREIDIGLRIRLKRVVVEEESARVVEREEEEETGERQEVSV